MYMSVSAVCLHAYTHVHVWLCVQKPTQACGPSAGRLQVPKGPHPRTSGCATHITLNFISAGGSPPSAHLGASPAAPQMPRPAGSARAPHQGWDIMDLQGDAHGPPLSGGVRPTGSVVLHVLPTGAGM